MTLLRRFALALMLLPFAASANYVSPEQVPGTQYVSPQDAKALFDRGVPFIDVRVQADYDAGRVPGAINLTIQRDEASSVFTEQSLLEVIKKKDAEVVFYCNSTSCWRTAAAAERAVKWGFTKVYYFRLGFPSWRDAGYPVE
ncbi:MAG: rhodanese-like domain-containing protein [Ectothiorhodospiraceae bacterium]|nr:rhodanese-like domain-containing protein [Ectothiorhodospiraceae bacterium]